MNVLGDVSFPNHIEWIVYRYLKYVSIEQDSYLVL
jgi:hypothetical protein